MSEARRRQLLKRRNMLNVLDRELTEEEFELEEDQSPVIAYFIKFYLNRGEPVSVLKRKSNISQFDRPTRRLIVKHYIVKTLLKDTNHELMKMSMKRLKVVK